VMTEFDVVEIYARLDRIEKAVYQAHRAVLRRSWLVMFVAIVAAAIASSGHH
jgi:hypothetical protein